MLNFVICDDSVAILERMCKLLDSIFISNSIEARIGLKSTSAEKVLSYTLEFPTDVFILDIDLKQEFTGIELASRIRKKDKSCYIIFTTGHLEYALLAYKVKAFDFLAKPITKERLEETIIRLIDDMATSPNKYIKLGNSNMFINQNDIDFIKRDGMKLVFYTKYNKYETYSSFKKLESCLSENFVRCHKSYIANVNNISNIQYSNNKVLFNNNNTCLIGPKYKNDFMEVIKNGNFSNNLELIANAK